MNVMETEEQKKERVRREAATQRSLKRAAQVAAVDVKEKEIKQQMTTEQTSGVDISTEKEVTETTAPIMLNERDAQWQRSCKLAVSLHRSDQIAEFEIDLHAGHVPQVAEPAMMMAALNLVTGMSAAGVRRWDFMPAPRADDLADPADWVRRRLAERRAEQDAADRPRRWDQKVARAFGQSQPGSSGTINPIHLQQSRHGLDELARRLEHVMAKHQAEHGMFKREWLDHRAEHYVKDRDGGISNKQIVLMANLIVGRQEKRPYDMNWKIVMEFMRKRRAEQSVEQTSEVGK